jgi:hypothetical protein
METRCAAGTLAMLGRVQSSVAEKVAVHPGGYSVTANAWHDGTERQQLDFIQRVGLG